MLSDEGLEALIEDRSSGASEITAQAREVLWELARASDEPMTAVGDAGMRLVQAHPAMAPLLNLVDTTLHTLEEQGPAGLGGLAKAAADRHRAVVEHGAQLVGGQTTVATYSRSGTVLDVIRAAAAPPRVLISEARPGREGLTVARELAEAGIEVTLTVDAALPGLLADAELLLVGADSLCREGVVNKVGTQALTRAASAGGCPTIVLASTDKLLPGAYRSAPPLTTRAELDLDLPPAVEIEAPLFEVMAWGYVDQVVTEQGRQAIGEIQAAIDAVELHPALAGRLEG